MGTPAETTRPMRLMVFLLLVVVLPSCTARLAPHEIPIVLPQDANDGLLVRGVGIVTLDAEIVSMDIGVHTTHENARAAVEENSRHLTQVFQAIRAAGVAEDDVGTTQFRTRPETVYPNDGDAPPRRIVQVTNDITVTVRDLDRVGDVLQSAIDAGVNDLGRLRFTAENPETHRIEARGKAVDDAGRQAQFLADAAGVSLGKPRRISDSAYAVRHVMKRLPAPVTTGPRRVPVPVHVGDLRIEASITLVYDIE